MLNLPIRLKRAEEVRTTWFESIPESVPLSAVMSPDYWTHVRPRISLHDLFEVVAVDGSYEATFRLVSINKLTGMMKFRLLSEWRPESAAEAVSEQKTVHFEVKWNFGKKSYCIYESITGKCVAEGFTKMDALVEADRLEAERIAA